MVTLDEISLIGVRFLFWYTFSNQVCIIIYAENRIARCEFSENPVIMDLINPYPPALTFVFDLCLFGEPLDEILDVTLLIDEDIISILRCFLLGLCQCPV